MKKLIVLTIIVISIAGILCGCIFGDGVSGENIKVKSSNEYKVYFNPVCPECDHISELYSVNLSEGEEHSTAHICEKCYNVYDIVIER